MSICSKHSIVVLLVCMAAFLSTAKLADAQSITFGAVSKVNGNVVQPNQDDEVEYDGAADLFQGAYASIAPPTIGQVEVKVTYTFSGEDDNGVEYNMSSSASKVLAVGDANWTPAGIHDVDDAVGTWTYTFKAEKKINGQWVPITGGSMSVTFLDVPQGGGGGGLPVSVEE